MTEDDMNARLAAMEIVLEETLFALMEASESPLTIARKVIDRARRNAAKIRGSSVNAGFLIPMEDAVIRMTQNLSVRLGGLDTPAPSRPRTRP